MVLVPGGDFEMGREGVATPVHSVTINDDFYMGKYEVTQAQYEEVTGTNPSFFTTGAGGDEEQANRPVETVTWYDAVEFCNKLSEAEGLEAVYTITARMPETGYPITSATVEADFTKNGYRLPTEAEWEYAAKGGNESPGNYLYSGSDDIDEVAWYSDTSGGITHEVGQLAANGLGIYDMSGNVYEWCWDWRGNYTEDEQTDPLGAAEGTMRVMRSGGYNFMAWAERSANRNSSQPAVSTGGAGFRLVRR